MTRAMLNLLLHKRMIKSRVLLLLISAFMCQSCATVVIGTSYKGNKPAVHVIHNSQTLPNDLMVNGKKEFKSKLIYNGAENNSPFYVHKVYLDKRHNSVLIQTSGRQYRSERLKSKGWFWISGLWYYLDKAFDGHHFYSDIVIL